MNVKSTELPQHFRFYCVTVMLWVICWFNWSLPQLSSATNGMNFCAKNLDVCA